MTARYPPIWREPRRVAATARGVQIRAICSPVSSVDQAT